MVLEAPPATCVAALRDVEGQVRWQSHLSSVAVIERDALGRPSLATLIGRAGSRDLELTLAYRFPSPNRIMFSTRASEYGELRGVWSFRSVAGGRARARLVLEARPRRALRLLMRGPGFERVRDQILDHLLEDLRREVERQSG